MMASVATMAEDDTLRIPGRSGISDFIRDLASAPAWSSPPASAAFALDAQHRVSVEAVVGTADEEFLSFGAELVSAAVLDDVETRNAALFSWVRKLDEICGEAATDNWDGESAAPVQEGAREYAIALVAELAEGIRFPEVAVDPDTRSLGWHAGEDVFSVSISGAGRFSYAGLFGKNDCHGTEWMVERVPVEVTRQLDRLLLATSSDGRTRRRGRSFRP